MAEPLFTDRSLQDAYRALMKDRTSGGHLDEATWDRIVGGQIDTAARDHAFDHVVECAECSRVWRGILDLKSEAETQGLIAAPAPASAPSWRSRWVPLAIAASAVLAIGSVVLYQRDPVINQRIVNRGTAVPEITGAVYVATGGFHWTPVEGASQYRVSVFTRDGLPVFTSTVNAPTAAWPANVPATAGSYTWRIEALSSGTVIARSSVIDLDVPR